MKQTSKGVLLFVLAFALILCLTLGVVALQFFWGGNEKSSPLPQVLGVALTDSTLSGHWDEHGWMGDGTEYWQVELSQEDAAALEKTVQTREGWHPLPVNEDGEALLYGREWQEGTESFSTGPYLTGKDGKALLPQVEEGVLVLLGRPNPQPGNRRGPGPRFLQFHRCCVRHVHQDTLLRGTGYLKKTEEGWKMTGDTVVFSL